MKFDDIKGKVLASIDGAEPGSQRVVFNFADGTAWASYHSPDCCESVSVNRITGDLASVIGSPVMCAYESQDSNDKPSEYADSWTWTHQRIRTESGEVIIVWLGESNGYYGETPYLQVTHGAAV